jgi:hypothetical protein
MLFQLCRNSIVLSVVMLGVIVLGVVLLNVVVSGVAQMVSPYKNYQKSDRKRIGSEVQRLK